MVAADEAARFADWARPSLVAMTRLARRLAPAGDADDVVQDALVRAWQKWHTYDSARGAPTTWLLAITADRARDARRSSLRRLRVIDGHAEPPDAPAPSPDAEGTVKSTLFDARAQLRDRVGEDDER